MHRTRSTCAVAFALSIPLVALAGAPGSSYDEAIDGDLSSDQFLPTDFGTLAEGAHSVVGSTTFDPLDRDFWTFTIAPGTTLESIILDQFDTTEDVSFLALEDTGSFSTLVNPSDYLGSALIGNPVEDTGVGDDVLDDLGEVIFGGTGFTGELGPGTYTLWFQETVADVDYGFTLNVTPAPGAAGLLAIAGLGAMRRRRA